MIRSQLPSFFPSDKASKVAVIGNSHSGILVCRNLYQIAESGERDLKVLNFHRRDIKFAEYRDDGVVFDSTGLKGDTADWAREHMTGGKAGPDSTGIIRQINLLPDESEVYHRYLPECTHIIYAIGYDPSPLPPLIIDGRDRSRDVAFDMHSSGFHLAKRQQEIKENSMEDGVPNGSASDPRVPGLYGLGIAFPEMVKDPEGHVEAAVGFAKFFKFSERVKDDWKARR